MKTLFAELKLSGVEHVWVICHVAESCLVDDKIIRIIQIACQRGWVEGNDILAMYLNTHSFLKDECFSVPTKLILF
jgi:hypothetical protein